MPSVRSGKSSIGLIASVLAVLSASRTYPETGTDLPVGGQDEVKLRSIQEIFGGECCARDPGKDIEGLAAAGNNDPEGIWSDGTTMWVADKADGKLYAYDLVSGARASNKDFDTLAAAGNRNPEGIWSDGTTMWVADYADAKIYAYNLTYFGRNPFQDVNSLNAAGNSHPVGIWSNGTTMWVADDVDKKLYAYDLTLRTDAPAILSVTAGTGSLTISWRVPPIETGTVVITGYDVRYIRSDAPDKAEANWTVLRYVRTTGSGTLFYEVARLAGGARYDLQLRTVTNRGPGSWSAVSSGTPLVQAPASTDFNGDGRTDFVDFFLFADAYGSTNAKFDLDGSGTVDFADFFRFVDAFGS